MLLATVNLGIYMVFALLVTRVLLQRVHRAYPDGIQQVADFSLVGGNQSFQYSSTRTRSSRNQHLLIDRRRGRDYVRLLGQPIHERTPVLDAVALDP